MTTTQSLAPTCSDGCSCETCVTRVFSSKSFTDGLFSKKPSQYLDSNTYRAATLAIVRSRAQPCRCASFSAVRAAQLSGKSQPSPARSRRSRSDNRPATVAGSRSDATGLRSCVARLSLLLLLPAGSGPLGSGGANDGDVQAEGAHQE